MKFSPPAAVLFLIGSACLLNAAAPSLDHLYPAAVQIGTTNSVVAVGKFEPWPAEIWVDAPEILFHAETNNGKFSVTIGTNALAGPHLVRMFNEQGASEPRFLIVTREMQIMEREPNDEFTKAQPIEELPAFVNGRLDKAGDVDSYGVTLKAGQTLIASVEAYTLASPMDTVLRVVDTHGVQVGLNHDYGGTLDPFLTWTANVAGGYVVQVFAFAYPFGSDIKFTGGNACVYRLRLSRGPWLHYTRPLGVQRGARTLLRLFGWNMAGAPESAFEFDGSGLSSDAPAADLRVPGFDNILRLPAGNGPELSENKPDEAQGDKTPRLPPFAVTSCIERANQIDRFRFTATKGEQLSFKLQAASFGSLLDPWLKVEDATGKSLSQVEDRLNSNLALRWSAPVDGTFVAAVGNIVHRGGSNYFYRFSVERALPSVRATAPKTAFSIEPGKTNEIKIAVARLNGFQSKLKLFARGLPNGLAAEPADVPEKDGDVAIKLNASTNAARFSGPIQFILKAAEPEKEQAVIAELITPGAENGYNKLVIESTDKLWLTVLPPPKP